MPLTKTFLAMSEKSSFVQTLYPRESLQTKIVHIGFGAFHRAHQAVYTDLANENEHEPWGIYGINLFRKGKLTELFLQQDNLATLLEKSNTKSTKRLIRTFTGMMNIHDQGVEKALAKLCEPQVAIVSLTITEKGYCLTPSGELNSEHPLIQQDVATPAEPVSAIGLITEALRIRKQKGLPAFSVMSCDNVPENGRKSQCAVLDYADLISAELRQWIAENVCFPNTMVDRIVPAMDDTDFDELANEVGGHDPFGLISEAFRQWVIEDQFSNGKPNWLASGAMMVKNVLPYEEMKLRMLNGAHSFLAYVGSLCRYDYVYQCMEDPVLKEITYHLMQEQALSLSSELEVNLEDYATALIERFSNPNIKHRLSQIAMDGTQKLPPRVIEPLLSLNQNCLSSDQSHFVPATGSSKLTLLLIAGWMHFIQGGHETGFQLIDPEADNLKALLSTAKIDKQAEQLLTFKAVFPCALLQHEHLCNQIIDFYNCIEQQGIRRVLNDLALTFRTTE